MNIEVVHRGMNRLDIHEFFPRVLIGVFPRISTALVGKTIGLMGL